MTLTYSTHSEGGLTAKDFEGAPAPTSVAGGNGRQSSVQSDLRGAEEHVQRSRSRSTDGLTARQLQWWDERRLFQSAVAPKRTAAGGFTERRYTPVDLLELMVLADLRRQGMTVGRLRHLLETLRTRFGVRLFDAIGGGGP